MTDHLREANDFHVAALKAHSHERMMDLLSRYAKAARDRGNHDRARRYAHELKRET